MISFAWTTPALLADRKRVTRRDWSPEYAKRFREGDLVAACDRQPRFRGKQVATIRLTCNPYRQSTLLAPESDYYYEGFAYLEQLGAKVNGLAPAELWRQWKEHPIELYVVRFELVEVINGNKRDALSGARARMEAR